MPLCYLLYTSQYNLWFAYLGATFKDASVFTKSPFIVAYFFLEKRSVKNNLHFILSTSFKGEDILFKEVETLKAKNYFSSFMF